jgi:hypothetical protein
LRGEAVPAQGSGKTEPPGKHAVTLPPGFDSAFADLELGYVDAAVMAIAQRDRLAVLTFDFEHFRATRPDHGFWQLVVDEHRYHTHTGS